MKVELMRFLNPDGAGGNGNNGGNGGGDENGGNGSNNSPDVEKETKELEGLLSSATLDAAGKARLDELKAKYDVQEVDENGNPINEEEKKKIEQIKNQVNSILAKPENQRTETEKKFLLENTIDDNPPVYNVVDDLTGEKIEFDAEGLEIGTPEWIAKREEVIRNNAVNAYDNELKQNYPTAYRLMLHLQKGGREEDFFKPENENFVALSVVKNNVVEQERILRKALELKGNTPEAINALVTVFKDSGKLYEQASIELKELQTKQIQKEEQDERSAVEAKAAENKAIDTFRKSILTQVNDKIGGVVIPQKERLQFANEFANNVFFRDGRYFYAREINPSKLDKEMASHYFLSKGGDLSKIVENKAADLAVKRIKQSFKVKIVPKGSGNNSSGVNKQRVALGDI